MDFEIKSLIDRLNPTCRKALEASAGLCVSQTNFNVELEHLLLKLLDAPNSDIARILKHYDVSSADVSREMTKRVDRLKRGNNQTPALSPRIPEAIQQAWLISSLRLGSQMVRSGALLSAMLE